MTHKGTSRSNGFTLVELIVVIAIIAILASVSIIGFTRYIENARLSNDNQLAEQMTDYVDYHLLTEGEQDLDAHDVRTIVETANGGEFDFTPQTNGAGFFFLEDSNTVIVHKYEDIINNGFELQQQGTRLLSDVTELNSEIEFGESPEEIFGEGTLLLSTSGSVYADVVHSIRNLADSDDLAADFTELEGRLTDAFDEYFELYDPENGTLYVNNDQWNFIGDDNDIIILNRVVFASGMSNVPAIEKNVSSIQGNGETEIVLPRTIRTIENEAFTPFLHNTVSVNADRTIDLQVEEGAFTGSQLHNYNISETGLPTLDIVVTYTHYNENPKTYSGGILTVYVDDDDDDTNNRSTKLDFDIQGLPRSEITSMQVNRSIRDSQTYYIVKAYTENGLLGTMRIPVNIVEQED